MSASQSENHPSRCLCTGRDWQNGDTPVPIRELLGLAERCHQGGREHKKTQAQLRRHGLGERADEDHAAIAIDRHERFDRTLAKPN